MATPFAMGPAMQPDSGTDNPPMMNALANTASAIVKGSLLGRTSNLLVALATTPALDAIVGVAAAANNTAPGLGMANQPTIITWGGNIIPYYPATTDTWYGSHVVNGSDTYVAPALAQVGVKYGLRVRADGEPCMDISLLTTNARVLCQAIDIENANKLAFWTFLPTAILGGS